MTDIDRLGRAAADLAMTTRDVALELAECRKERDALRATCDTWRAKYDGLLDANTRLALALEERKQREAPIRYAPALEHDEYGYGYPGMEDDPQGGYVKYDDYLDVAREADNKLAASEARLEILEVAVRRLLTKLDNPTATILPSDIDALREAVKPS